MQEFIDEKGGAWSTRVDSGAVFRIRDRLGVNISNWPEELPPILGRMHYDLMFCADLLYQVCLKQANERHMTEMDFHECVGESLESAVGALMEGLIDFFQRNKHFGAIRVVEKFKIYAQKGIKVAADKMEQRMDVSEEEISKLLDEQMKIASRSNDSFSASAGGSKD